MITLSLCLIVKNEEDVLARCLACVDKIADEIIVVDTGSTDKTKEIAEQFTSHVYFFPWCDDFAAARNFSFSRATMNYVMWLDADDILTEQNQNRLMELKQTLSPETDMVMMKYDVSFDNQGSPTFSYYRERIFKRAMNYQWVGEIHEVIPLRGSIQYEDISVYHKKMKTNDPERNLHIFEKIIADGKALEPRQQYYYGRELYYTRRTEEAIRQLTQFLEENKGWIENNISACKDLAACYYAVDQPEKALECLFKSFSYDQPRAEICCEIGQHFLSRGSYKTAVFWYDTASSCIPDEKSGAFCQADCYGYIPYIQLCVCYDRMGIRDKAIEYNEKAGKLKPDNASYLYNKEYFTRTALI